MLLSPRLHLYHHLEPQMQACPITTGHHNSSCTAASPALVKKKLPPLASPCSLAYCRCSRLGTDNTEQEPGRRIHRLCPSLLFWLKAQKLENFSRRLCTRRTPNSSLHRRKVRLLAESSKDCQISAERRTLVAPLSRRRGHRKKALLFHPFPLKIRKALG